MRFVITSVIVLLAAAPAAALTILDADFEGEPLDQLVGTGGPVAGQPISYSNVEPYVRGGPMGSACLEMTDIADYGTGSVLFEFLDAAEVADGSVEIACDLWVDVQDDYVVYVREQGASTREFLSIDLDDSGWAYVSDAAGQAGSMPYATGRSIHLRVVFDMDARTYNLWWDRQLAVLGRAHGIGDRGVGRLSFGPTHDTDLDGRFYLDDLRVETGVSTADESAAWGAVKSLWR